MLNVTLPKVFTFTSLKKLRLIRHNDGYRLEAYWTRATCGVRRRSDNKHMYMACGPRMEANIRVCNYVVSSLENSLT